MSGLLKEVFLPALWIIQIQLDQTKAKWKKWLKYFLLCCHYCCSPLQNRFQQQQKPFFYYGKTRNGKNIHLQIFFTFHMEKSFLVRKWQTNLNKKWHFFHICKLIFFAFSNFAIIEEMASTKLSSCKSKTAKTDDLLNIYHEGSSSVSCLDTT